jgi:hypothetical protein
LVERQRWRKAWKHLFLQHPLSLPPPHPQSHWVHCKKRIRKYETHTHTPSHTNAYKQNTHARLSHSLVYFLSIFFSLYFCVGTRRCISSLFES